MLFSLLAESTDLPAVAHPRDRRRADLLHRSQSVLFFFHSFIRRVGRTPWFIAYDATYDAVVISIRGTWSLTDVVTDILAGPRGFSASLADVQPLDEAGKEYGFDGTGEYTHRVPFERSQSFAGNVPGGQGSPQRRAPNEHPPRDLPATPPPPRPRRPPVRPPRQGFHVSTFPR